MDNLPIVEDVVEKNIFTYDIDIEDGDFVGELTITLIGKHEPISVSISSNLLDKPILLFDKDPQSLIIDFVANLELLAEKKQNRNAIKISEN